MGHSIFINLPVADVDRSRAFYSGLGFELNPHYSNDQVASMKVNDHIVIMLMTKAFYAGLSDKQIADPHQATSVLHCFGCDSRAELDDLAARALAHGGSTPSPLVDHGFMIEHGFEDPDGHGWGLAYMVSAPA